MLNSHYTLTDLEAHHRARRKIPVKHPITHRHVVHAIGCVWHTAHVPFALAVHHLPRGKTVGKLTIGAGIAYTGAFLARVPVDFCPHILWDTVCYGLHGYGALPFIKLLTRLIDLENLELNKIKK